MRLKLACAMAVLLVLVIALPLAAQNLLVVNAGTAIGLGATTDTSVSVFGPSLALMGTYSVPVPAEALSVAWSSAAGLAAVANFNPTYPVSNAGRIDFFNPAANPPITVGASVSTDPISAEDLVFSPDGACLVVGDGAFGDHVVSINVGTRTVASVLNIGANTEAVEFIPNNANNVILTADFYANSIHVLTMASNCVLTSIGATILLPASPINITALPNGLRALVANREGSVSVLSISGTAVSLVDTLSIGGFPQSIAVLPDGTKAYVSRCQSGGVEVLNIDGSNNVTDSGMNIATSGNSCYFGVNQAVTDGNNVFVTGSANVQIIPVGSTAVSRTITAGASPAGLALTGVLGGVVSGCAHHTVHGHIDRNVVNHPGNQDVHHGQHGHTVSPWQELCGHNPPGGHILGLTPEAEGERFSLDTLAPWENLTPTFWIGVNEDGTLNGEAAVAPGHAFVATKRGAVLQLFGSADGLFLGKDDGQSALDFTPPASGSPLYYTTTLPEVRIGGVPAKVEFSGLAPGLKGVWQINVRIPEEVAPGKLPIEIFYEGEALAAVRIAVE